MNDVRELKKEIEGKSFQKSLLIMEYDDDSFLPDSYWKKLVEGQPYKFVEIEDVIASTMGFSFVVDNTWKICRNPPKLSPYVKMATHTIIVCQTIKDSQLREDLKEYIYTMPKLTKEHIKDWLYAMLEGVDTKYLDVLGELCGWDIHRIQQEVYKFQIFVKDLRHDVFLCAIQDGVFSDLSNQTIFDFTNGLLKKDLKSIIKVYKDILNVDITEMYFYTVVTNTFRNACNIQLQPNPTPENTGLTSKQIYAISKSLGRYSNQSLKEVFTFLTDVDRMIKEGEIPMNILRDYITLKVFAIGGK